MYELSEYLAKIAKKADIPLQAVIRESDCIGCMKCLQACPVDAIVGAAKQMHTVIVVECTGCELCVEPCPVDCIDMIALSEPSYELARVRRRFEARANRLAKKAAKKLPAKESIAERKAYIAAALMRVKARRSSICSK